jgi:hypothetical protein
MDAASDPSRCFGSRLLLRRPFIEITRAAFAAAAPASCFRQGGLAESLELEPYRESSPSTQAEADGASSPELSVTIRLRQELVEFDAIVRISTIKQRNTSSVSVSEKKYCASVGRLPALHGGTCSPAVEQLNAHEIVGDKMRVIVCDGLDITTGDWT